MFGRKKRKEIEETVVEVATPEEEVETTESIVEEMPLVTETPVVEEKKPSMSKKQLSKFQKAKNERDAVIAGMVKEVEMFSGDGEFEMKKNWIGVIFGILLIVGLIAGGIVLILNMDSEADKKGEEDKKLTITNYSYAIEEGVVEFYLGSEKISAYHCSAEPCDVYIDGKNEYFSKKPTVIALNDGGEIFLYDYVEDKVLSAYYTKLESLKKDGETVAFIAHTADNVGVINSLGKVIIPIEYLGLGYSIGNEEVTDYSYEKDIITAQKESGWGVISLETGAAKIPFSFEDIYYNGYDSVVAKKEGVWYLLDMEGNQLLDDSYDIIIPTRSYIFVARDGLFNIVNYSGKSIIKSEIPTYIVGFRSRTSVQTPTFKIEVSGSDITIYIMKDRNTYDEYNFNTINGDLNAVIR